MIGNHFSLSVQPVDSVQKSSTQEEITVTRNIDIINSYLSVFDLDLITIITYSYPLFINVGPQSIACCLWRCRLNHFELFWFTLNINTHEVANCVPFIFDDNFGQFHFNENWPTHTKLWPSENRAIDYTIESWYSVKNILIQSFLALMCFRYFLFGLSYACRATESIATIHPDHFRSCRKAISEISWRYMPNRMS